MLNMLILKYLFPRKFQMFGLVWFAFSNFSATSSCPLPPSQFHDKIDPTLESLKRIVERLRQPPAISAEVEKIKEQISENKNVSVDLEKLQPVYETLKRRGEEMIARSEGADKDISAKGNRLSKVSCTGNAANYSHINMFISDEH